MLFEPRFKNHKGSSIFEMILANSILFGLLVLALFPVTISSGNTGTIMNRPFYIAAKKSPTLTQTHSPHQTQANTGGINATATPKVTPLLVGVKLNLTGGRTFVSNTASGLNDDEAWILPLSMQDYNQSPCLNEEVMENRIRCYLKSNPTSIASFISARMTANVAPAVSTKTTDTLGMLWQNISFTQEPEPKSAFANWILLDKNGSVYEADSLIQSTSGITRKVREHDPHNRTKVTSRVPVVLSSGEKTQAIYQIMRG